MPSVILELAERATALALEVAERGDVAVAPTQHRSVDDRITAVLTEAGQPQPFSDLRALCRVRSATLYERLAAMATAGRIIKSADGYSLVGC